MNPHRDFEARLRAELRARDAEPGAGFRDRLADRLSRADTARETARGDGPAGEDAPAATRSLRPTLYAAAALAASLVALVALRASTTTPEAVAVPGADPSEWTAGLDGSASRWESDLVTQGDRMAEDARRAALDLLGRLPAAPWAQRTDR